MKYNEEDARRVVSENEAFLEWVEERLESMGFRVYGEVEVSFQEDGKVRIDWRDPWEDYQYLTVDWEEIYDETGETWRKAQEERKRVEEERRAARERDRLQADLNYALNNLNRAMARAESGGVTNGSLVTDKDGNYKWV